MKKFKAFLIILIVFLPSYLFSNSLIIKGLNKLTIEDLQSLTTIDLSKDNISLDDLNLIINDLYNSDLIYDVSKLQSDNQYVLEIVENNLIENIFINGNIQINDVDIVNNLFSKTNTFLNLYNIERDINIIKSLYSSIGYDNSFVDLKTEKFSSNRINLIYQINEGRKSELNKISFMGNKTFSDKYLNSIISSKVNSFYNIFSSGSNLNFSSFQSDISKLTNFYKNNGFFDVDISYQLEKSDFSGYLLNFYIYEGDRVEINLINFLYLSDSQGFQDIEKDISKVFDKNNRYYNLDIIEEQIIKLEDLAINNGYLDSSFEYELIENQDSYDLIFSEKKLKPVYINQIFIEGNSITKDKTLRSKLSIEPGDIINNNKINLTRKRLNSLKYINSVNILNKSISDNKSDIQINIDENKKTGNFLFGASFSGDTGVGAGFSIKDYNLLGSGNEIDASVTLNSEQALFKINYTKKSNIFPDLTNSYNIFNEEKDLASSFGYKVKTQGIGYKASFSLSKDVSMSSGVQFESSDGYNALLNTSYINDNIGNFDNLIFNYSISQNSTNDFLYPTNGSSNRIYFEISPNNISDDNYYKIIYNNEIYYQFKNSKNFLFTDNNFGFADSIDGKLKTNNAFSLGGLNFKGFEYRGIGPIDNNYYLGGNKYFTSTIGYGSSFLFDEKDNINIKLFLTTGSLWGSDYTTDNDYNIRSSAGFSLDILTIVGPISLSFATPIEKNYSDKTQGFNFSIGTSF